MADDNASYEIGYGKPPLEGRFQKGKSGNPSGRPRGSRNLASIVLKDARQKVRINGPRGARSITKLEAAVMQVGNQSAQGNLRASREFFALVQRSEESVDSSSGDIALSELDDQVIANIRRRLESISTPQDKKEKEKSE